MTDMQRFDHNMPDEEGDFVLASDAEAAIAAAEQRGHERGANETKEHLTDPISYQQGERDMLAKCIEAVDALYQVSEPWTGNIHLSEVIGALRALQEKP